METVISDEARRIADAVNAYRTFMDWDELKGKWIAFKLADGSHDGVLYDSKRDAVRHQSDEFLCAYISFRNLQQGISAKDAEIFLRFNRDAYDHGFRLPDPDSQHGGKEVLMTTGQKDYWENQLRTEFWDRNQELWRKMIGNV